MKYLQLAHTGACTNLKKKDINLQFTSLPKFYNKHILECVQS